MTHDNDGENHQLGLLRCI